MDPLDHSSTHSDEGPSHEGLTEVAGWPRTSRRHLIRAAARLAVAAPIALAAMPGIAAADAKSDDDGDADEGPGDRGRGRGRQLALGALGKARGLPSRAALPLVRVTETNGGNAGGGDFQTGSPGADAIASGAVAVDDSHQVLIALRGAPAGQQYSVQFERLDNRGREDLGTITVDGSGNFVGAAPNVLSGAKRVGIFVLQRGGADELVSAWP